MKRRQDAATTAAKAQAKAAKAAAKASAADSDDDEDKDEEDAEEEDEEDEDTLARCVVVHGVPAFFSDLDLATALEAFGEVESVFFHVPAGSAAVAGLAGLTAEAVFADPAALDLLFASRHAVTRIPLAADYGGSSELASLETTGLARWEAGFAAARPDFGALQTQIDVFMAAFDKRSAAEKAARKASTTVVDDEGFTLVVAADKKKQQREKSSQKSAVKVYERKIAQRAESAVTFYKFQDKERRAAQTAALRRKFDEDKARLNNLKLNRSFRPL